MLVYALGITLKYTLKNHIYTFNKKFYIQEKGGAIGVGIAGVVAVLFMVWWDKQLLQKLHDHAYIIHLYGRYVDDINIAADSRNKNEKETMQHIQTIANSIHPSISVTIDYPSNNPNNRLPVLDLEMWIGRTTVDNEEKQKIIHSHYIKPMSSKHVINKHSAIPEKSKKNILQ